MRRQNVQIRTPTKLSDNPIKLNATLMNYFIHHKGLNQMPSLKCNNGKDVGMLSMAKLPQLYIMYASLPCLNSNMFAEWYSCRMEWAIQSSTTDLSNTQILCSVELPAPLTFLFYHSSDSHSLLTGPPSRVSAPSVHEVLFHLVVRRPW